jgi:hypothetical protein
MIKTAHCRKWRAYKKQRKTIYFDGARDRAIVCVATIVVKVEFESCLPPFDRQALKRECYILESIMNCRHLNLG